MAAPLTEYEKMISGERYLNADPEINERSAASRRLLAAFNAAAEDDMPRRQAILKEALIAIEDSLVRSPVTWEFGNIAIGRGCFFNYDCIFLDSARITFGRHVAVGPRVVFATASHAVPWHERAVFDASGTPLPGAVGFARPICVEDHAWIGASVTVLPGVTIGARSTVAAGSVVTRSVPPDVVAAGNPCRVIRSLE